MIRLAAAILLGYSLFGYSLLVDSYLSLSRLSLPSRLLLSFREELLYEKEVLLLRQNLHGGRLKEVSESLASEWNRYIVLREFLDYVPSLGVNGELEYMGKTTWEEMTHLFGLMIGYRPTPGNGVSLRRDLVPDSWKDLTGEIDSVPSITIFDDFVDFRLSKDLPVDEEEGTQLVLEILGGMEMSKLMQEAADKGAIEIRRKLLLVQWLYVYNFLGSEFPPKARYVPYHMRAGNCEDSEWDE